MEIKINGGVANLYTPYNPDFVKKIKGIGGAKWNGKEKCWQIPEDAVDAAREIMRDIYGYSDISENETVKLRITVNDKIEEFCKPITLFGKVISSASGRDSGAWCGENVSYIKGEAKSGGSVKNWMSVVEKGSVIILTNVNRNIFEKEKPNYDITVEVLEENTSKKSLIEEREQLLKRIAEIDKILKEVK